MTNDAQTTGSLVVIGTGIKFGSHLTIEARAVLEHAEKVFFLVNDPASVQWIHALNPSAESLSDFYVPGQRRLDIYRAMASHILASVRQGMQVCAVFYGHPGVLVTPAHEMLRIARQEGLKAHMLPGISAEDCLFADLLIDPASDGCQSFDATDFLLRQRHIDPQSHLILWQVGVTGELFLKKHPSPTFGWHVLLEALLKHYDPTHVGILYEAAQYPSFAPRITQLPLEDMPNASVSSLTTLYVPPIATQRWDTALMDRFGITWSDVLYEEE